MVQVKIQVLVADDHPVVRQGLEVIINSQPDMVLIGQAVNGEEALRMIADTHPDVVVMDLKMPVKDGLTAIAEIRGAGLPTRILALTSFPEDELVLSAIQSGADGVILKDSPPDQLIAAIRTVIRGEGVLHPIVAQKLIKSVQQASTQSAIRSPLTQREVDVLRCLAQGHSNREIALELSISTRTVTTHVRNILDKLDLDNRTQAALYAVEHGLMRKPVD